MPPVSGLFLFVVYNKSVWDVRYIQDGCFSPLDICIGIAGTYTELL